MATVNTPHVGASPATAGALGINDANSTFVKPSIAENMIWERRNEIALTAYLTKMGNVEHVNSMGPHTVLTHQEFDHSSTTDTAITGTVATDLSPSNLDFTTSGLREQDILINTATDEMMRVTTVASGVPTVVTRGWGDTTATAIGNSDTFVIAGNALVEGSEMIQALHKSSRSHDAYCQIVQQNINLTDEARSLAMYGPQQWDKQLTQAVTQFHLNQERALLLNTGVGHSETISGREAWSTGGLWGFAKNNSVYSDSNGTITYDEIIAAVQPLHEVGSTIKTVGMCGLTVMGVINKIANNRSDIQLQTTVNPGTPMTLGSTVQHIVGDMVDLKIIYNEALNDHSSSMIVFKPDELSIIEHSALESKDVQTPGTNALSHKMQRRVGLKIKNQRSAMLLKNLVTAG